MTWMESFLSVGVVLLSAAAMVGFLWLWAKMCCELSRGDWWGVLGRLSSLVLLWFGMATLVHKAGGLA